MALPVVFVQGGLLIIGSVMLICSQTIYIPVSCGHCPCHRSQCLASASQGMSPGQWTWLSVVSQTYVGLQQDMSLFDICWHYLRLIAVSGNPISHSSIDW